MLLDGRYGLIKNEIAKTTASQQSAAVVPLSFMTISIIMTDMITGILENPEKLFLKRSMQILVCGIV